MKFFSLNLFVFFIVCFVPSLGFPQSPSAGVAQAPRSPVIDLAHIVSAQQEETLNSILKQLWASGGSQIQILTLPSLDGVPIAQKAFEVSEKWALGDPKKDNGVLLLVSNKEKKIRIEVGQGLEGDLPDGTAWKIIEDVMVPLFRSGRGSAAIYIGAHRIVQKTDPSFTWPDSGVGEHYRSISSQSSRLSRVIMIIIIIIFLLILLRGPRGMTGAMVNNGYGRSPYEGSYGSNHWRGGGGFGGGGSGGWGGGGGGFGGGGASGGW